MADYDGASSRTWDIANTNKLNPHSKKPVGLKLVSRGVPALLPREGGLVWNRAGFARHAVHVTKYADDQLYPASRHVPQTSDSPSLSPGLPTWISEASSAPSFSNTSIENTDVVLWHTFGITHFPSPEDFPIMPAEPMSLSLRPRNFFARNPALDVKPSWARSQSQVAVGEGAFCGSGMDPGRKGDGVSRVV
ncbi:Copper amine oxidase [Blastomyces dermatitidis]